MYLCIGGPLRCMGGGGGGGGGPTHMPIASPLPRFLPRISKYGSDLPSPLLKHNKQVKSDFIAHTTSIAKEKQRYSMMFWSDLIGPNPFMNPSRFLALPRPCGPKPFIIIPRPPRPPRPIWPPLLCPLTPRPL